MVDIPDTSEKNLGKPVTFYNISVQWGDHSWLLEKRFSQFDDLINNLRNKFTNLPKLPAKTFMNLKSVD